MGRRRQRGVSEVAAVIVLAVLGLVWTLVEADRAAQARQYARGHTAGALFARWMTAAHRRAQEEEALYVAALPDAAPFDVGVAMSQAGDLQGAGYAPGWLTRGTVLGQEIALGVINDPGLVPMAFAVASPSPTRAVSFLELEGFHAGAAGGGVIGIEALGTELGAETFSGARRDAIEDALGRALDAGDLVAVADVAIVYDERVVHRRRQPGREYLSQMETALAFVDPDGLGGEPAPGVSDAAVVYAVTMESAEPDVPGGMATFVVGRAVGDPEFDVDGDGFVGARVDGNAQADRAGGTGAVEGSVVYVHQPDTALAVPDAEFTGALGAQAWTVGTALDAGTGTALDTASASTVTAAVDPGTGTGGVVNAQTLAVSGTLDVTTALDAQGVEASTLGRSDQTAGVVRGTTSVGGASVVGNVLRVNSLSTGGCSGC